MSLPNCRYLNPPHPQVQISTSILTPVLHGMKVWWFSTYKLNALLRTKCFGPQGQCIGSHLNTWSGVMKITHIFSLIRLNVNIRAWYATQVLTCRMTKIRILHRRLLINRQIMSTYTTPAWSCGHWTWWCIPEILAKDFFHVYNWCWTAPE